MPLNRLRRVLTTTLNIAVESTQHVADLVNGRARPHMNPKLAAPYQPIIGSHERSVRAIDLLRKIGEVTTPRSVNLARLSASWATRRYFWCIHDFAHPVPNPPFRLSQDARRMERQPENATV